MPRIIDAETLKSTPVSIGLLVSIVPLLIWAWSWSADWHYETFVTIENAEAHTTEVTNEIQQTHKILEDHIVEFRIARAQDRIEDLENKLYFLERDQAAEGETALSRQRIGEVRHELQETQVYLDCLIDGRPNCKHLEPRRK